MLLDVFGGYTLRRFHIWIIGLILVLTTPFILAQNNTDPISFSVSQYDVQGNNPLTNRRTRNILQKFVGVQDGFDGIQRAAQALQDELRDAGFAFLLVTVPPQSLEDDVVTLQISKIEINNVSVLGNTYHGESNIVASFQDLTVGSAPNTRRLSRALAIANFNPAKNARITMAASDVPNAVDAEIIVQDRPPRQLLAWLDNTGNTETGDTRAGAGFQHANLFDRDHVTTLTYITSPEDTGSVTQLGGYYQIPVYRAGGLVNIFAVDSQLDTGTVAEFFDVSGSGKFYGARYTQVLNKIGDYRHRLGIEYADKLFDNTVGFLGTDVGVDVRSRPLTLSYRGEWEVKKSTGEFYLSHAGNLTGGSSNDEQSYANARVGASDDWSTTRAGITFQRFVKKDWLLTGNLDLQFAGDPLIAGEQLGLTGVNAVRGFEEREVTADRGYVARLEMWGPISKQHLRPGGFIDHGNATRLQPQPGEVGSESVSSVGAALTWQWRQLSAGLNLGYVIDGVSDEVPEASRDGDSKLHASLVYRRSF